jgi:hypothetical protein
MPDDKYAYIRVVGILLRKELEVPCWTGTQCWKGLSLQELKQSLGRCLLFSVMHQQMMLKLRRRNSSIVSWIEH